MWCWESARWGRSRAWPYASRTHVRRSNATSSRSGGRAPRFRRGSRRPEPAGPRGNIFLLGRDDSVSFRRARRQAGQNRVHLDLVPTDRTRDEGRARARMAPPWSTTSASRTGPAGSCSPTPRGTSCASCAATQSGRPRRSRSQNRLPLPQTSRTIAPARGKPLGRGGGPMSTVVRRATSVAPASLSWSSSHVFALSLDAVVPGC